MKNWFLDVKKRVYPSDRSAYYIDYKVISDTSDVLVDYKNFTPSHEGLAYWAGTKDGDTAIVRMVVAPNADSAERRISTSHRSNAEYVKLLARHGLVHIAQVHSHPGQFIDHSSGDDEWAPFKRNGLLSIVVPSYCEFGILPLKDCGIHKFIDNEFVRLNEEYIEDRFRITSEQNTLFEDLRYEGI